MDVSRLTEDLRSLEPMQEKVVRLHYGLGCERAHAPTEIARAMAVTPRAIREVLQGAQQRLGERGWGPEALRSAARLSAEQALEWNRHQRAEARPCRGRSL